MLSMLVLVMVAGTLALVGGTLWREYEDIVHEAEYDALNNARLLAGLLAHAVEDLDRELDAVAASAMLHGRLPLLAEPVDRALVVTPGGRTIGAAPELDALPAARERRPPAVVRSIAIHPPVRDAGGWKLVFSRPIPGAPGQPDGVVIATVPAGGWSRLFAMVNPDTVGTVGVTLADGTLLLRAPFEEERIGRPFAEGPALGALLRAAPSGTALLDIAGNAGAGEEPADRRHLLAYQSLPDLPVAVVVARPWLRILAAWRQVALTAAFVGLFVAILVPTLTVALFLRARRLQAAEDARRAAEAASRAKSDFLAMMSHELRTPLNTILGFSEMIRDRAWGSNAEDRYVEYAGDIHTAGTHLMAVLNDVLDLAKIEAGHMTLHPEPLCPGELAEACLRLASGHARASGVTVTADVAEARQPFVADPRATRQMIVNLLSNACKFTPKGGAVRLTIRTDGRAGGTVSIADTGVGMTAAEVDKALQRFGQVDNPLTRSRIGTGLGLPLVQGLMELHGGGLSIDSTPGRGTTVTLSFPPRPSPA